MYRTFDISIKKGENMPRGRICKGGDYRKRGRICIGIKESIYTGGEQINGGYRDSEA